MQPLQAALAKSFRHKREVPELGGRVEKKLTKEEELQSAGAPGAHLLYWIYWYKSTEVLELGGRVEKKLTKEEEQQSAGAPGAHLLLSVSVLLYQ